MNGYNATNAYLTIYQCAESTANSKAYLVLRKPEAQEYLKELQSEHVKRLAITADKVLTALNDIAFAETPENEKITASQRLKALELIQKQIGAQAPQKIEADISQQVVFIDDTDSIE